MEICPRGNQTPEPEYHLPETRPEVGTRPQNSVPLFCLQGIRLSSYPQNMAHATNPTKLIRAVLFDFDGTLTEPGSLDFYIIKEAVGCPKGIPVLEFIQGIESAAERARAFRVLDEFEAEAARQSRPNDGAEEILALLRARGLKIGIISRNSRSSILTTLDNFTCIQTSDFSVILSRDDPFSPKPSPDGILAAADILGIPAAQVLVVGDFVFDIEAGHKAGALTAYLTNRDPFHTCSHPSDFTLEHLGDLKDIINFYAPLPPGKLANDILGRCLAPLTSTPSPLLIGPGIGEDVAALPLVGEEVLVLKSDPITFAADAMGVYAVSVNINDIATSGATPRWLLTSLFFPVGVNACQVDLVMHELHEAAQNHGLLVCGGHTEITDAVTRTIISVQIAGTASRCELINKKNLAKGDCVLLTKKLAIEGTSILAREFPDHLRAVGISEAELARNRAFLFEPGISILKEARIAAHHQGVSAMHDITEGGLSTALLELSTAGGHRIRAHLDRIPVYEETEKVCGLLGLNPLGLIASGSLLIACRAAKADELIGSLCVAGIDTVALGEVLDAGTGVEAVDKDGKPSPWPHFETDELARFVSELADPEAVGKQRETGSRNQGSA
jgi:hydrogenase expression/formation protein HypE